MKSGFTLLELSIVLVIIGLIIGGITVGADMIRAAELQNVIKEKEKIVLAVSTFKLKYNAIPGDMDNATAYWGSANADATTCKTTASTGKETCDGNGNGKVESHSSEMLRFWQQLAAAELISGSYSGVAGPSTAWFHAIIGENVPAGAISGSAWFYQFAQLAASGNSSVFDHGNIDYLTLGAETATHWSYEKIINPQEAEQIDTKIDDGKPGKGKLVARYWDDCTDAASSSDFDADYLLSVDTVECALYFFNPF